MSLISPGRSVVSVAIRVDGNRGALGGAWWLVKNITSYDFEQAQVVRRRGALGLNPCSPMYWPVPRRRRPAHTDDATRAGTMTQVRGCADRIREVTGLWSL